MAVRYLYNGQKYNSLYSLRQAIGRTERLAYGNPKTQEEFDKLPLKNKVVFENFEPEDEIPDGVFRNQKKTQMLRQFSEYCSSKYTAIDSSLGFKINANTAAFTDVDGLIAMTEGSDETIEFRDYENKMQSVTHAQLVTMKKEIAANRSRVYKLKWQYSQQIEAADRAALKEMVHFSFEA